MPALAVGRGVSVLGVVGALLIVASAPAFAASGAEPPQRELTVDGRPLSHVLDGASSRLDGTPRLLLDTRSSVRMAHREDQVLRLSRQTSGRKPQSWIKRHPALFGGIVGALAGASIVGATVHSEAAFVGFYGGGAAGAAVGWIVSR